MRSYFCRKCDYEFDQEEEFSPVVEGNSSEECPEVVFCPKCLVTVAEALPETPERILARERRLRHLRQEEKRRDLLHLSAGILTLIGVSAGMVFTYDSYFWMLVLGLIVGVTGGFWTRKLTQDRSWRAGLLALGLFVLMSALCIAIPWSCGRFLLEVPARNLIAGGAVSWIIAVFDV